LRMRHQRAFSYRAWSAGPRVFSRSRSKAPTGEADEPNPGLGGSARKEARIQAGARVSRFGLVPGEDGETDLVGR
jgi:hypothetical protein